MKKTSLLMIIFIMFFNTGCTVLEYQKKAPPKDTWKTSKNYKDCDSSQIWPEVIKQNGINNMIAGGTLAVYGVVFGSLIGAPLWGVVGLPSLVIGYFIYEEGKQGIENTRLCTQYKEYKLSK